MTAAGESFAFTPFPFFGVSGAGNDFVALPEPPRSPTTAEVRAWCRRGLSLGADGVFALRRAPDAAGAPPRVVMEHWNADGSAADLCLNGTRCAARLAFELGWTQGEGEGEVEIVTGAGPVRARVAGPDRIRLDLPLLPGAAETVSAEVDGAVIHGTRLVVGVPHLVIHWPQGLAEAPVEALGKALVHHPAAGPAGANVDFLYVADRHHLELRTYERGVYAETLACGTGVMAAVAVAVAAGEAELPISVLTRGGFVLDVEGELDGHHVKRWSLTGDARLVARGELLAGAETLPVEPSWSSPDR